MKEVFITIPKWNDPAGTEAIVDFINLQPNDSSGKWRLFESFIMENKIDQLLLGKSIRSTNSIRAFFKNPRMKGVLATYERNWTYLECKGDCYHEFPKEWDLLCVAGCAIGFPVPRNKLEKILQTKIFLYPFAAGAKEVFLYYIWTDVRYDTIIRNQIKKRIPNAANEMLLSPLTISTEKITTIKRKVTIDMNFSIELA